MKKFYITTPLYYVNATPHIGHSYTNIAADCLARYKRNKGYEVYLLTGTDEHGQKIAKASEENRKDVKEFVDEMVINFKNLWRKLNISYDDFIRTTEKRHIQTVEYVLDYLYKRSLIYEDTYKGWYCLPCETFWTDLQLEGKDICPDCARPLERLSEKNYFFKLSQYQNWLIDYIESHPNFIRPSSRYQEVLRFLKSRKLSDLCISRPVSRLKWGIPIPFAPNYVTYVWFDALLNYISAIGFGYDEEKFRYLWPADVHLIGKDILRQHAIYWPIILHALDLQPPKMIFAHGWWRIQDMKISKSRGNVIDPIRVVNNYGVDVYRYFLLRDVPFGLDGNFSEESLVRRLNSDLANDLGNLLHRIVTMIEKYLDGRLQFSPPQINYPLLKETLDYLDESNDNLSLDKDMTYLNFSSVLDKIWDIINATNKFIEDSQPWNMYKVDDLSSLKEFINVLVFVLRKISWAVYPFMPQTAEEIDRQLSQERITKGNPLFPRR